MIDIENICYLTLGASICYYIPKIRDAILRHYDWYMSDLDLTHAKVTKVWKKDIKK